MSVAEKNTPPINLMEVVEKLGGAERIRRGPSKVISQKYADGRAEG